MIDVSLRFLDTKTSEMASSLVGDARAKLLDIQNAEGEGSEMMGWYDWPRRHGFELEESIQKFKSELDVDYDLVVVIGIGGSYLGTRAVDHALTHSYDAMLGGRGSNKIPIVYTGCNLSESELIELQDLLDKKAPLINIISKSGTTTEPAVAFRVLRNYLEKRYGTEEAKTRIIATTDPSVGALRQTTEEEGIRSFPVPCNVGGRFSVLTAVGLVPLALAGHDTRALLEGADGVFRSLDDCPQGHSLYQYATVRKACWDEEKRIEVMNYSEPRFFYLVEWWKQLFGESEGKEGVGLFPAGLASTTDLHSLGQYMQDGCRNLMETFIKIKNPIATDEKGVERRLAVPKRGEALDGLRYLEDTKVSEINAAASLGTALAHRDGGVSVVELTMGRLDEGNIGEFFAFMETACGISAALLEVNPYSQPGVEDYKKNLFGLTGKPGFEELGEELKRELKG